MPTPTEVVEDFDELAEEKALLGSTAPRPVVNGFDTAALFLLDLSFTNLFEETNASSGSDSMFRCKGCRRLFPRRQRESHWKVHRASRTAGKYQEVNSMAAATKENKAKQAKVTALTQGFPQVYLADNGNFRVGMDARAKSDLVCAVLGIESPDALHKFTAAEATKLIAVRGWESFVEKKKQAVANAEERKAKAAAAKADKAKTAAASKASKPKAAASKAKGEATPDPKPTRSSGKTTARKRNLRAVK